MEQNDEVKRTVIIGDIHGCIEPFENLMEQVNPGSNDRLILLGDLFDRGSESWEVFQKVRQLAGAFGNRFILLRGNHEDYLLQTNPADSLMSVWNRVGRGDTVNSFRRHGEEMEDAAPWIRQNARLFFEAPGFQCVHAGVIYENLADNDLNTLIHDHNIVLKNRYSGKLTITGHIAVEYPTWFKGNGECEQLAYHRTYKLPSSGVICIDTGCGKGGVLTGMIIEDEKFHLLFG
ncbi:MAG: metallophosphoesterase [Solobacterium sp.]|nr:metallophosphoesterase [Solobacterium sp.]